MFERVHFIPVSIETPHQIILPSDVPSKLPPDAETTITDKILREINPDTSSDYLIDGLMRTLPIFPVTDAVTDHYCWLQSFGWADSGPAYFTRRVNAQSYLLMFTVSGSGILEYEGERYELGDGDGFFIDCRRPHYYRTCGNQWEHVDMHFTGPMIDPVYAEYNRSSKPVFHQPLSGDLLDDVEELALLLDRGAPCRDFQAAGIIYRIAVRLLAGSVPAAACGSAVTENLQYLIRYIDRHYPEKLTLDFLSRFSGISKYYLSREFHRYTGFPPNEYIIRQRIGAARIFLETTTDSVSRIAELVGIPNVQHFSRQFKRVCGVSPREYRAAAKTGTGA